MRQPDQGRDVQVQFTTDDLVLYLGHVRVEVADQVSFIVDELDDIDDRVPRRSAKELDPPRYLQTRSILHMMDNEKLIEYINFSTYPIEICLTDDDRHPIDSLLVMKVIDVTLIFAKEPVHRVRVRPHSVVSETGVIRRWFVLVTAIFLVTIAPLTHRYPFLHDFIVRSEIRMREAKVAVYRSAHFHRCTRHLFLVLLIESIGIVPFWSEPKWQKPHVTL